MADSDTRDGDRISTYELLPPERPEHRACRDRTAGECLAVTHRIVSRRPLGCRVCGGEHEEP